MYKKYATDTRKGGGKRNIQLASAPSLCYNHEAYRCHSRVHKLLTSPRSLFSPPCSLALRLLICFLNVDNPQKQQKITAFVVDFVFHRTVDKLLIVFAGHASSRGVDNFVENFAHVVHNFLSHWLTNEFRPPAAHQSLRGRSGARRLERVPRSDQREC